MFLKFDKKCEIGIMIILLVIIQINTNNHKNKKFLERCEDMLTCDACVNKGDYCGWCYSDGRCKSGNEIGPSGSEVCKFQDWETSKCQRRKCEDYKNLLGCVSQYNCFSCENFDLKGNKMEIKCHDISKKYNIDCTRAIYFEDYMKSSSKIRGDVQNNLLNEELEKLYTLTGGNSSLAGNFSSFEKDPHFLKYENFVSQMNVWVNKNGRPQQSLYNSISNPAGLFSYQIDKSPSTHNKQDYNLNLGKVFDHDAFHSLSLASKKEMINLSQKVATDLLKSMFIFLKSNQENPVSLNEYHFKGAKNYLVLETIAGETWKNFLKTQNLNIMSIQSLMSIDSKKDRNLTEVLIRQSKMSIMYPFKLNSDDISFLNLKNQTWAKLPGTNFSMNAYINTTVLIAQKIRLFGQGKDFESVFLHNQHDMKSLSLIQNKKRFDKIDITNFAIRKLSPGLHNFYFAYKTDFKIFKNNENNMILTNTLEIPFTAKNGLVRREGGFNLEHYIKKSKGVNFDIRELRRRFRIDGREFSSPLVNKFNFIAIYNIFKRKENIDKNLYFRMIIKNLREKKEYKETISSNALFIPASNAIQNIGGMTLISLPEGEYDVDVIGRVIFEEPKLEKITDVPQKEDHEEKSEKAEKSKKKKKKSKKREEEIDIINITEKLDYIPPRKKNLLKKEKSAFSSISPSNEYVTDEIVFLEQNKNKTGNRFKNNTDDKHKKHKKKKHKSKKHHNHTHGNHTSNMTNSTDKNSKYEQEDDDEIKKPVVPPEDYSKAFKDHKEHGEVTLLKLPISSLIYTNTFKSFFNYKGNSELNEIPNMKRILKITTEKNVLIQTNILLTLPSQTDFEFRLYINGKDDCDSLLISKEEHLVNLNSVSIERLQPGDYSIELFYLASKEGYVDMTQNDWDIISMNLVLLEVQ
jgi:hypothetical protein